MMILNKSVFLTSFVESIVSETGKLKHTLIGHQSLTERHTVEGLDSGIRQPFECENLAIACRGWRVQTSQWRCLRKFSEKSNQ